MTPLARPLRALPLVLGVACSAPAAAPPAPQQGRALYAESLDFAATEALVPRLAAAGVDLYQVLEPPQIGDPALASLLRACASAGVGVRAWLVLDKAEGLWPSEANVDRFAEAVGELLAWIERDDLPVEWLTFDLEPSWDYTQAQLALRPDPGDTASLAPLLELYREHRDPARFAASRDAFTDLVARVHDAGLRVHAVTYPMVLDDAADGDPDLQDIYDIPVTGIDWDEVSFMVYRSTWASFSAGDMNADLLYSYAALARAQFGERAAIDLGVVGLDPITASPGYDDPDALARDVAAARAAGVDALHLYSLNTAAPLGDLDPWLRFADTPAGARPEADPDVDAFHALFATLDLVLED